MQISHPSRFLSSYFIQQQPQPASEVFCPALEGQTLSPTLPPVDITVPTPPPSASAPTTPEGTPTKSPVASLPDTPSPTKRPTSKKPSSAISGSGSNDYDVNVDPESIGHGAKAGKPYKIPDGLSMPGNGLIMDHFDLSTSRSGKRRQLNSNENRRNSTQGSRFMMKKRDRRQQDTDEEAFGTHRRIAKHREETANRRRDVLFVDDENAQEEPVVMTKVDSRRLRRN